MSSFHRNKSHFAAIIVGLAAALASARAQTNTFPASGAAGVGGVPGWAYFGVVQNTNQYQLCQLELSPTGGGSSTTSLLSKLRFDATFDQYPSDQSPRATAELVAGYHGGAWGNEYLAFEVGNSNDAHVDPAERMRLTAAGNLGIGTTNPMAPLSISQGTNNANTIELGTTGTYSFRQAFNRTSQVGYAPLEIQGSSISLMNGNVGIGTTAPNYALDVFGDVRAQNSGMNSAAFRFNTNNNYPAWNTAKIVAIDGGGNFLGSLAFYTHQSATSGGEGTERMRINSAGNVGIGTPTPGATLDVNGTGSFEGGLTVGNSPNVGVNNGLTLGTVAKNVAGAAGQGAIQIASSDSGNQLQAVMQLVTGPTAANRRLAIQSIEQGIAFRNITLGENGGNVGIGTANPTYPLSVNGTIQAKEVLVQTGWSDYVFDRSYSLEPLNQVEQDIATQHHLPGIPSATEVAQHGVSMGQMEAKLLAKVEELTLHAIEQEKALKEQAATIQQLQNRIGQIEAKANTP